MDSRIGNITKSILATFSPTLLTKIVYFHAFNKWLDLKKTSDFNEKVLALKLGEYYNNDLISMCADKYEVRSFLHEEGYGELLPQLYKVTDNPKEIHWESLPKSFIIKCTHGSGYNIICPDKACLDLDDTIGKLNKWLKEDYWKKWAETQYKYVKHRIIIEEYLGKNISTYKFYCFNGEPKVMYVSFWGENGEYDKYYDYYDMDWHRLNLKLEGHENSPYEIGKPGSFEEMKHIARNISKQFKFVRVDLYDVDGKVYFSELTFVPTGGLMRLHPNETLEEWGSWLEI